MIPEHLKKTTDTLPDIPPPGGNPFDITSAHGVSIGDPWVDVPTPGKWWLNGTDAERRIAVGAALTQGVHGAIVAATQDTGEVVLELIGNIAAGDRGHRLRQIEANLKRLVDPAIVVYLRSTEDRNAVRRFRGIEVRE